MRDGVDLAFVCDRCSLSSLPFANDTVVDGHVADAATSSSSASSSSSLSSLFLSCPIPRVLLSKGLHFSLHFSLFPNYRKFDFFSHGLRRLFLRSLIPRWVMARYKFLALISFGMIEIVTAAVSQCSFATISRSTQDQIFVSTDRASASSD